MRALLLLALSAAPLSAAEPTSLIPADAVYAVRIDVAAFVKKNPFASQFPAAVAFGGMARELGVPIDGVESVVQFGLPTPPVKLGERSYPSSPEPVTVVTTLKPYGKPSLLPWENRSRYGPWMAKPFVKGETPKKPEPPPVAEGEIVFGYNEVFVPINDRQYVLAPLSVREKFTKGAPAAKSGWLAEGLAAKGDLVIAAENLLKAVGGPGDVGSPEMMVVAPLVRLGKASVVLDLTDGATLRLSGTPAEGDGPAAVKTLQAIQTLLSTFAAEGEKKLVTDFGIDPLPLTKPLRAALDAAEPKVNGGELSVTLQLDAAQLAAMAKALPGIMGKIGQRKDPHD